MTIVQPALAELARSHGIFLSYKTIDGQVRHAEPDVLLAVLKALGESPNFSPNPLRGPNSAFKVGADERRWGLFVPLYALHGANSWGAGDFSDLDRLIRWTAALGGQFVATLPLLPVFLETVAPSPYSPISRLFWNEFYIDPRRLPEMSQSPEARAIVASPGFAEELDDRRRSPLVDYAASMAAKEKILSLIARTFFSNRSNENRREAFERFLAHRPEVTDYARFRSEKIAAGRADIETVHYHEYVQWIAEEQIEDISARARRLGCPLALDFPLGVHPDGYDVRRHPDLFVPGISVGAPPDPFHEKGQDWGFPPIHPDRIAGSSYYADCLEHHARHAGILRIDHVMGWHRLFWIPNGFEPSQGVYVQYPAESLYATACEISARHRMILAGEDLGTVPPEVRSAMREHSILRSHILEFDSEVGTLRFTPVPADAMAALDTHDLPPFASFWRERGDAKIPVNEALRRSLDHLAASDARLVAINLEDLWGEIEPQNRPGTLDPFNWRRKVRRSFEEFSQDEKVCDTLKRIDRLRRTTA